MGITVATWNTEWATPSSARGPRIAAVLAAAEADVVVVTEGVRELLPAGGCAVDAGPDWGYGSKPSRRKVIVWSRFPLTLDFVGAVGATRGRLAAATVEAPDGPVRVIGVCIPWRDAHVSTGRGDATSWSEHLDYLERLERLLAGLDQDVPTVIAGDFNQRIPRERQPVRVAERLNQVFAGWTVHTAGAMPNGPHIDHIATNQRLHAETVHDWAASDHMGRLSDHAGVACRLTAAQGSVREHGGASTTEPRRAEPKHELAHADTVNFDEPASRDNHAPATGELMPDMRAEIEDVLRRSGDGLSHGATFQLREQGFDEAEIAARRGVSAEATRVFLRSLDLLLEGKLPKSKSAALTNSCVHRELLNHARSHALDCYVKARLCELKELNPEVSFAPLKTRSHQQRVGKPKQHKQITDSCPECAAVGITHAGRC
ncbi:MAG: endonuclease/exonuclease/phosphatase family protein [Mycobacterium sp.]